MRRTNRYCARLRASRPSATLAACLVAVACSGGPPDANPFDELLTSGKALYSQGNEELIVRHFFRDRRDGFFLDVGAWHWKQASTTYYLEAHLGWTGIAVDALRELVPEYRKNRPGTRLFTYIVGDSSGGMADFYAFGALSSTVEDHLELFGTLAPETKTQEPQHRRVPTITLDDLLGQNGVTRIDFLSMDIEQGEPAALAGFDIERFRPELVVVEMGLAPVREKVIAYMAAHGYVRIEQYAKHDITNWYYTPR